MTEFLSQIAIFFYNHFTDKRNNQSDKSPVERNTEQRKIEVRYMAFVFHLHHETKAL